MTQYRCPRCGNVLESNASFCPHCGTPVNSMATQPQMSQPQPASPKSNTWLYVLIGVLLAACLGVGAWLLLAGNKEGTSQPGKTETNSAVAQSKTDESQPEVAATDAASDTKAEPDAAAETPQAAAPAPSQGHSSASGVYMGLWGQIGDSDQAEFEMNGTTGTYSYVRQGQSSGKRTLRLVSYNPRSGRCIIDAFAAGKKIGTFDGRFYEISETDDEGTEHFGQSYSGKFTNVSGAQIDFSLYFD